MADDFIDYDIPQRAPEGTVHLATLGGFTRKFMQSSAKKGTKEALEKAAQLQAKGLSNQEILHATKGIAQIGLHGKPIAVIPHGDVTVLPRGSFTHPERVGDIYQAPRLEEEWPELMNLLVKPNPNIKWGSASLKAADDAIHINPRTLLDSMTTERLLAHELTHGGARISQGGFGQLSGTNSPYIKQVANHPMLEQAILANSIRSGRKTIMDAPEYLRESPNFGGLLKMPQGNLDDLIQQATVLRSFKHDPSQIYHRTYGEQLANWMMNPAEREVKGAVPHLTESWEGPRHMDQFRRQRLLSQTDPNPSSMLADDFQVLLNNYFTHLK